MENLTWKKKKVYRMWNRILATWEEYRNVVSAHRDGSGRTEVQLELNVVKEVKGKKKGFFKYVNSKKTREDMGLLLNEVGVNGGC